MVTLRHLKIFAAVAHYRKMNIAAKQLFVSQPTISQTISELEKEYHVELFERFPKELQITPAGSVLLSHALEVIHSFDKLNHAMLEAGFQHKIRAGATLTVGNTIINEILDRLREIDKELDVTVHIDNTSIIERKLLTNELDIAIVEGIITSQEILTEPILEDALVLICSPKHPFSQKKDITSNDLKNQDFIMREKGSGTRELFINYLQEQHIPVRIKWECNSSNAIKQAVIHNHGLAVLSERLVKQELEEQSLCIVNYKDFIWKRYFYLCYHRNKNISLEMQEFIETAKSYVDFHK